MKTILRLLGITIIISSMYSCEKIESDVSDCIKESIRDYAKSSIICDSGASVAEFSFQDQLVYVFNPGTCGADMGADVYNDACEKIGFLGGIAGITEINGVRFYEVAIFNRNIWVQDW